ncbi:MAG: glycine--tRNA ligase subunit beta [Proteobacteria bacterium]|nr:glycine--tRNA ligase subunit beta [Pseudomonadota bacterium]
MKKNQKYIPLTGDDKKLTNKFIVITNNDPKNPKNIIDGNERVLRARLNDALFFYQKDLMTPFSKRKVGLERITYHNLLGTVNDRVDRITKLVTHWGHQNKINPDDCLTAAHNSKNDLSTLMVNEFPELQGIMGKYYFNAEGCNNEVAQSIEDQYKPRFAGDDLPVGKLGKILSLADKSESIAGLISINQTPTGDKDPFAMRRSALGIISILLSENISLNIDQLISESTALFCKNEQDRKNTANTMSRFLFDRLFFQLKEKGNKPELIRACKNYSFRDLYNIPKLLFSLEKLLKEPTSMEICAINKRIKNILEKIDVYLLANNNVNESLLAEPAEKNLYKLFVNLNKKIKQAVKQKSFSAYFDYCLQYRLPIENFFDKVLVNSEDKKIRQNRITLLNCVYRDMNLIADLSSIASTRND